jgi:hypothetical protein
MADRGFDIESDMPNGVFLMDNLRFQLKMRQKLEKLHQFGCMLSMQSNSIDIG